MNGVTKNSDMDKRNQMTVESEAEFVAAKMNFIKTYADDAKLVQDAINDINNRLASMKEVLKNENSGIMFGEL